MGARVVAATVDGHSVYGFRSDHFWTFVSERGMEARHSLAMRMSVGHGIGKSRFVGPGFRAAMWNRERFARFELAMFWRRKLDLQRERAQWAGMAIRHRGFSTGIPRRRSSRKTEHGPLKQHYATIKPDPVLYLYPASIRDLQAEPKIVSTYPNGFRSRVPRERGRAKRGRVGSCTVV